MTKYGGNPKVVISEPDIKMFKITNDMDFIILASNLLINYYLLL